MYCLKIQNFKSYTEIHQHMSLYGKILVFLGDGHHKIKKKAEQTACENAINNLLYCQYGVIYTIDNHHVFKPITSILPKWNIPENNSIVCLNSYDSDNYYKLYPNNQIFSGINCLNANISIIIPELHAEDKSCPYHIENVNKVLDITEKALKKYKNLFLIFVIVLFLTTSYFFGKYNFTKIAVIAVFSTHYNSTTFFDCVPVVMNFIGS